jgi:VWFA-related protein
MLLGQASQSQQQKQGEPDAPTPQPNSQSFSSYTKDVVPGSGTAQSNGGTAQTNATPQAQSNEVTGTDNSETITAEPATPHTALPDDQKEAPVVFHATLPPVSVNYVDLPVTVEDKNKHLVPGLSWRDFRVFENSQRMKISYFSTDPEPLSVALVIDQSVGYSTMAKVNEALSALPAAFATYDEVSVFTYNAYAKEQTAFTAAQSARLMAVIDRSKVEGRDTMIGPSGPMALPGPYLNDTQWMTMPTVSNGASAAGIGLSPPKEPHPLNDAILKAAEALSTTEKGRRRVIYVISDGREVGSTAKYKEVIGYLKSHDIAVYGTLVGDSAAWGLGFLDRMHLPLMMADNILPQYAFETGGQFDSEFSSDGIERSFAKIAEQVRTQYTIGYYSPERFIDGKYRDILVQVTRSGLNVIAKQGYTPSAEMR